MFFRDVPTKMPGPFAGEVTLITLEGFSSSVFELVLFQIRCLSA